MLWSVVWEVLVVGWIGRRGQHISIYGLMLPEGSSVSVIWNPVAQEMSYRAPTRLGSHAWAYSWTAELAGTPRPRGGWSA